MIGACFIRDLAILHPFWPRWTEIGYKMCSLFDRLLYPHVKQALVKAIGYMFHHTYKNVALIHQLYQISKRDQSNRVKIAAAQATQLLICPSLAIMCARILKKNSTNQQTLIDHHLAQVAYPNVDNGFNQQLQFIDER
eukprot:CAMPEP_0201554728 /NCGR_PEP_ID=MMETSP0173_2-20130828/43658_1 /ASSEMBLY_ACC=CAM_ASM_000268 /TAXON_ID=218659 /ORGANISM="Vexillifera sp., Strain DIVA3 564/2" /LENGTH=137 /DNA_ID=CAMNT_0047966161 /DNA_START=71 /DNA_END=481 /DNA_ORIENTATION=-